MPERDDEPAAVTIPGWGTARLRELLAAATDESATDVQRQAAAWQIVAAVEHHLQVPEVPR